MCCGQYDIIIDEGIVLYDEKVKLEGVEGFFVQGEMVFEGDKFWWIQGVYEFRYYYYGKYNVMLILELFEVCILLVVKEGIEFIIEEVENVLLFIVWNCFDCDLEIVLEIVDELWGVYVEWDGKYVERVVYVICEMFVIEFLLVVVLVDGNVKKLVWRVVNGRIVFVSFFFLIG